MAFVMMMGLAAASAGPSALKSYNRLRSFKEKKENKFSFPSSFHFSFSFFFFLNL